MYIIRKQVTGLRNRQDLFYDCTIFFGFLATLKEHLIKKREEEPFELPDSLQCSILRLAKSKEVVEEALTLVNFIKSNRKKETKSHKILFYSPKDGSNYMGFHCFFQVDERGLPYETLFINLRELGIMPNESGFMDNNFLYYQLQTSLIFASSELIDFKALPVLVKSVNDLILFYESSLKPTYKATL